MLSKSLPLLGFATTISLVQGHGANLFPVSRQVVCGRTHWPQDIKESCFAESGWSERDVGCQNFCVGSAASFTDGWSNIGHDSVNGVSEDDAKLAGSWDEQNGQISIQCPPEDSNQNAIGCHSQKPSAVNPYKQNATLAVHVDAVSQGKWDDDSICGVGNYPGLLVGQDGLDWFGGTGGRYPTQLQKDHEYEFQYAHQNPHPTWGGGYIDYHITKNVVSDGQNVKWSDFVDMPFSHHTPAQENGEGNPVGEQGSADGSQKVSKIPSVKLPDSVQPGRHVVLTIWQISMNNQAWYSCSDVIVTESMTMLP
jgi:predicted carbohydrate-binding protein with CBM5 and CBM33 domain